MCILLARPAAGKRPATVCLQGDAQPRPRASKDADAAWFT